MQTTGRPSQASLSGVPAYLEGVHEKLALVLDLLLTFAVRESLANPVQELCIILRKRNSFRYDGLAEDSNPQDDCDTGSRPPNNAS